MEKLQINSLFPKQIIIKNDMNDEWNGKYIEGSVQYKDKNSISYLKDDNHHVYLYNGLWKLGKNGVKVYKQLGNEISNEIDARKIKSVEENLKKINDFFLKSLLKGNQTVKNKNCICMMCIKPSQIWIDFLLEIKKKYDYDIFVVVDDNSKIYEIDGIYIIQIGDKICKEHGFFNANFCVKRNVPSSWDKMFFYFSYHNNYKNYWVIEEDVFIPIIETISCIDKKYSSLKDTVLIRSNYKKESNTFLDWHWGNMKFKNGFAFPIPWFCSEVCAVRLPNPFLYECKQFVLDKKQLFFIEFFINTLADKRNINVKTIDELSEIHIRKNYVLDDFKNKNKMYHAVKDINFHKKIRNSYK